MVMDFWTMAEKMLSNEGMDRLQHEVEQYDQAVEMAHEAWAERRNEYALAGTDDVPMMEHIYAPAVVLWIEQLVTVHNERVVAKEAAARRDNDIPF